LPGIFLAADLRGYTQIKTNLFLYVSVYEVRAYPCPKVGHRVTEIQTLFYPTTKIGGQALRTLRHVAIGHLNLSLTFLSICIIIIYNKIG